ncbi:MAG TPA: hypothetical protein VFA91_06995 [Candidatus Polarisedimenticolia bacterium]|nr:hypothetical protein [Candidatus Polarisedimenticolia bacterium]
MSEDKTQQNADALLAAMATIGDWAEEIDGSVMACAKALARIATALEGILHGLEKIDHEVDREMGTDG